MVISSLRAHILSAYFLHHLPAAQWLTERKPKGWINRLTTKPSTTVPTCLRSFHGMDVDQCVLRTIHGGIGGTICRVHHLLRRTDLVIGVDDLGHSSSVWNKMHLGKKNSKYKVITLCDQGGTHPVAQRWGTDREHHTLAFLKDPHERRTQWTKGSSVLS